MARISHSGENAGLIADATTATHKIVIAWPDVWHDEAQLEPHLIRARSGNYGLILVGSDQELEDAKLDARLRSNARLYAEKRLSMDDYLAEYEGLIGQLVGRPVSELGGGAKREVNSS